MHTSGRDVGVGGAQRRVRNDGPAEVKIGGLDLQNARFWHPRPVQSKTRGDGFLSSEIPRQPMLVHPDVSHALGVYCLTDSEIREFDLSGKVCVYGSGVWTSGAKIRA